MNDCIWSQLMHVNKCQFCKGAVHTFSYIKIIMESQTPQKNGRGIFTSLYPPGSSFLMAKINHKGL